MSAIVRQLLIEEEGRVPYAYPDSKGYLTVGVGHLVDPKKGGRLPDVIVDALLDYDVNRKTEQAATLAGFGRLNEVQQAAVISMVFQLGLGGVMGFHDFCAALAAGDVVKAAAAGRDSKWDHEDSPARAEREMKMLETGLWVPHMERK